MVARSPSRYAGKAMSWQPTSLDAEMNDAVRAVRAAEEELVSAVDRLVPILVGDKKLITPGLEFSFEKLRAAQDHVHDLQQNLTRV
jgi:hypothetical protein